MRKYKPREQGLYPYKRTIPLHTKRAWDSGSTHIRLTFQVFNGREEIWRTTAKKAGAKTTGKKAIIQIIKRYVTV